MPRVIAARCRRIADSSRFQGFIMAVIVANAITLGLGTYDFSPGAQNLLTVLDEVFLGIFVVELAINILIAIIINSVEEVHDLERQAERQRLGDELATGDGSVADRLDEIRHALDKLETQLAEGGAAPARRTIRPSKGGRMRG